MDEQARIDQILAPQARALFAKLQSRLEKKQAALTIAELKVQMLGNLCAGG